MGNEEKEQPSTVESMVVSKEQMPAIIYQTLEDDLYQKASLVASYLPEFISTDNSTQNAMVDTVVEASKKLTDMIKTMSDILRQFLAEPDKPILIEKKYGEGHYMLALDEIKKAKDST